MTARGSKIARAAVPQGSSGTEYGEAHFEIGCSVLSLSFSPCAGWNRVEVQEMVGIKSQELRMFKTALNCSAQLRMLLVLYAGLTNAFSSYSLSPTVSNSQVSCLMCCRPM
jgi:hypothetical protein